MADPAMDGWPADKVFDGSQAGYAYDDVVFLPGHVSFEASDVDLGTKLTRNISVRVPLVGAALGTVTGAEMAIALALDGGMGIVHGNQSIDLQVEMIKRVKRYIGGFILEPIVLGPMHTLNDLDALYKEKGIRTVPITEDGKIGSKLVGWVGKRDSDACDDRTRQLRKVMVQSPTRAVEPVSLDEAMSALRQAKVGKLPIVDEAGGLVALVTRSDLKKIRDNPLVSRTASGQLLVGAAVPPGRGDETERAAALLAAGADLLFVDCAGCAREEALGFIKALKAERPDAEVLAGPAASCREAKRLIEAGAAGVFAGAATPPGGGAYGGVAAVGRPEATAVFEISRYVRLNYQLPVLAGPGVQNAGQMLKAFALGASAVLLGDPLAGTDETPGQPVLRNGAWVKPHYHSAEALGAMRYKLADKHCPDLVPRLPCVMVPCQGSAAALVRYLLRGLKNGMQDLGFQDLATLHKALDDGDLRLECRCPFATAVHSVGALAFRSAPRPEVMPCFVAA